MHVVAELWHVLRRRSTSSPERISHAIARLRRICELAPLTAPILDAALDIAVVHGLQIFDALILATAAEMRCEILLSEDMQDGFSWRGTVVCNPFGETPDPQIAKIVAGA